MKRVLPVILFLGSLDVFGQAAQLVMQNGAYIKFAENPTTTNYLVIQNPATTGIVLIGAQGGNIVTEHENNRVRWMNGSTGIGAANTFTVPLTAWNGTKIPVSVHKTAAGSTIASNSMVFSSYNYRVNIVPGGAWDNTLYMPSGVTHMNADVPIVQNNSNNVIDRFWIVDTKDPVAGATYATNPALNISLTFDPSDALANGGNVPGLSGTLMAQRFNTTLNKWGDFAPAGTLAGNVVSNILVPAADVFRSWTLANGLGSPLPIELLAWEAACDGGAVVLKWSTASETDNAYFTIERSEDADDWRAIAVVEGAGTSTQQLNYQFIDHEAPATAYYRLRQTDFDGRNDVSPMIVGGCEGTDGITIVNAWDDLVDLNVVVSSSFGGVYEMTLTDAQGRTLSARPGQVINQGATQLKLDKNHIAPGIYTITLHNADRVLSRRLMVN